MRVRRAFPVALLLVSAVQLMAATYAPKKLLFTGADQYRASDLTAVTGLTPGKQVTTEEVEAAMQKLVDTGLFSDMRYTVNDQVLTFMLTPVAGDQLLSAHYKNFVWWSDEELTAWVHERIPLFTGQVPVTGTMKEGVCSALTEIVASKSVKASVSSINSGKLEGQVEGTLFAIEAPLVEIGGVRIDQVSSNAVASIEDVKKRFSGQDYDAYKSGPSLRQNVQNAYLDLGYLDIAVDPPVRGTPDAGQSAIRVSLTTTAHEGSTYHVSKMEWPESQIVSKATFADASQLKAGDVASRMALMRTEGSEAARFESVGYLDAKVTASGQKDEAHHEIAYAFSAVPGEQYRVASVKTPGLSADQQSEFDKVWKLAPGQFYNDEPIKAALQKLGSNKAFQGYAPKVGLAQDRRSHTVVITISFVKGSRPS